MTSSPPPDPEVTRDILQRVFSNPQLQQRIEEDRSRIRQRLERGAEGQRPPQEAAPASKPDQTPPQ